MLILLGISIPIILIGSAMIVYGDVWQLQLSGASLITSALALFPYSLEWFFRKWHGSKLDPVYLIIGWILSWFILAIYFLAVITEEDSYALPAFIPFILVGLAVTLVCYLLESDDSSDDTNDIEYSFEASDDEIYESFEDSQIQKNEEYLYDFMVGETYEIVYPGSSGTSTREILVKDIREQNDRNYIDAICLKSKKFKTFRLDRIKSATNTETGEVLFWN